MAILLGLLVLPLAFLALLVVLARRKCGRVAAVGAFFFVLAVAAGFWAITRSRSSTAGIGVIFLPVLGVIAGLLGLGFERWRGAPDTLSRAAGWLCLVGGLAVVGTQALEGSRSMRRNANVDAQNAVYAAAVVRERAAIATTLAQSAGRETETLDAQIRARAKDRPFLLAALESPSVSAGLLDSLALSPDLGIALMAVRNPSASPATLERVYRKHTYPDYFVQALAANPRTPATVLRAIYERPRNITGLDIWFAGNPATPADILERIARTSTDLNILNSLLGNPSLDCALLTQTAQTVEKVGSAGQSSFSDAVASRAAELRPTLCR
jgi:hypothetical protein